MVHSNHSSELKFSQFITCLNPHGSSVASSPWTMGLFLAHNSTTHSSGMVFSDSPLQNSFFRSQSGPSRQSEYTKSSSGVERLDGMPEGFSQAEQCLQWSWGIELLISVTLFYTKGLHSLLTPCIQKSAILVSVKEHGGNNFNSPSKL